MVVRSNEIVNKPDTRDASPVNHDLVNEHNGGTKEQKTALLDQARSQFTRGGQGETLDLSGHDKLYGRGGGGEAVETAPAAKVDAQAKDVKADGKVESLKTDAKDEVKADAKVDVKPDAKDDVKGHANADVKALDLKGDPGSTATTEHPADSPDKTVKVKAGDSLWEISREQLGPDASETEVMENVRAIAKANGMRDPFDGHKQDASDVIHPGQELKIPARDKSEPTDRSAKPEVKDSPEVQKQKLEQEKQKLDKNMADNHVSPEDQARIRENMKTFEERAAKDNLSPEDVRKTYEQANRLYESQGDSPIPKADKAMLADQIISNAANPTEINQGGHNTCGPTSLESRLFTTDPADAAKVIADVGTTGVFTAKDGTKTRMTANDLKKDAEASTNPPEDGARSYASKLFQEAALNSVLGPKGKRFVETPGVIPGDRSTYGLADTEKIVDSKGRSQKFDGVFETDISDMEKKITGKRDPEHFIENQENTVGDPDTRGKVEIFKNEQEFKERLKEAKAKGEMPLTVWIDSRRAPFGDGKKNAAGGDGGGHFVNITDYDESTGKVKVSNQWGSAYNHIKDGGISVDDMYEATRPID